MFILKGTDKYELPCDIQSYLFDTFEGFDLDASKTLDRDEFWQFMNLLNFGLSNDDIVGLMNALDANFDGSLTWKEIIPKLVDWIHAFAEDDEQVTSFVLSCNNIF